MGRQRDSWGGRPTTSARTAGWAASTSTRSAAPPSPSSSSAGGRALRQRRDRGGAAAAAAVDRRARPRPPRPLWSHAFAAATTALDLTRWARRERVLAVGPTASTASVPDARRLRPPLRYARAQAAVDRRRVRIILIVFTMVLIYKALETRCTTRCSSTRRHPRHPRRHRRRQRHRQRHCHRKLDAPHQLELLAARRGRVARPFHPVDHVLDALESVYYNVIWLMLSGVVSLSDSPSASPPHRAPRTSRGDEYVEPAAAAVDGGARDEGRTASLSQPGPMSRKRSIIAMIATMSARRRKLREAVRASTKPTSDSSTSLEVCLVVINTTLVCRLPHPHQLERAARLRQPPRGQRRERRAVRAPNLLAVARGRTPRARRLRRPLRPRQPPSSTWSPATAATVKVYRRPAARHGGEGAVERALGRDRGGGEEARAERVLGCFRRGCKFTLARYDLTYPVLQSCVAPRLWNASRSISSTAGVVAVRKCRTRRNSRPRGPQPRSARSRPRLPRARRRRAAATATAAVAANRRRRSRLTSGGRKKI